MKDHNLPKSCRSDRVRHGREYRHQSGICGADTRIVVHTNSGGIYVKTSDRPQAYITARDRSVRWLFAGRWQQREFTVDHLEKGNVITCDINFPILEWHVGLVIPWCVTELIVPAYCSLDLVTGNGTIVLDGFAGDVVAETTAGDIVGRGLRGSLNANTERGAIKVTGQFCSLSARSGAGDISVDVSAGSEVKNAWSLNSQKGNLTVRIPMALSAILDADAGRGESRFEYRGQKRIAPVHAFREQINAGTETIFLRSSDYSIRIGHTEAKLAAGPDLVES